MNILKRLFCHHNNSEVVCWHWTHGMTANEIRFLEILMKCPDCGKYYFTTIHDQKKYDEIISKYRYKQI